MPGVLVMNLSFSGLFPISHVPSRGCALFVADAVGLVAAFAAVCLAYDSQIASLNLVRYRQLMPWLLMTLLLNRFGGLYEPIPRALHAELADLLKNLTITYMSMALILYITQRGLLISRGVILGSWAFSCVLLPALRHLCRRLFRRRSWWGPNAIFFGPVEDVRVLLDAIVRSFDPVIRPVGYFSPMVVPCETLKPIFSEEEIPSFVKAHDVTCAVAVLTPDTDRLVGTVSQIFRHVVIIPSQCISGDLPVLGQSLNIGTVLGFKVGQNLLDPKRAAFKRFIDVIISGTGLVVLSPVLLAIAAWITVESPGSPFFVQRRLGLNGKPFACYKFRTMIVDADSKLDAVLAADSSLAAEWSETQKLKNDPRLISVGRFLRRTSLDELPQLWNVFVGDMSLVGPRPIVESEIVRYGEIYKIYVRVRPGITGFWQVSGRSDTDYARRVSLDRFYIYNWSLIFDFTILLRTIPVVLFGKGAV